MADYLDKEIIRDIAKRARILAVGLGHDIKAIEIAMDLELAHEICPLKLRELLEADNSNFAHDVFGIRRHLDRMTGELQDCFLPRFAKRNDPR